MGPLEKISHKISVRLIKIGIGEAIDLMGEQTPMKIFKATWFYETYLFKLTGRTYNPIFVGLTSQFLQSQLLPLCVCVYVCIEICTMSFAVFAYSSKIAKNTNVNSPQINLWKNLFP